MLDINAIGQDTTFLGSVNMCPIEDLKINKRLLMVKHVKGTRMIAKVC